MKKSPPSKTLGFLAEELKVRRQKLGLSQDRLAEKTGLSMAQISEIERGIANPTLLTLEKIADSFGIPVAELLNVDDVLNSSDRIKAVILDGLGQLSVNQLKVVVSLIRIAQR